MVFVGASKSLNLANGFPFAITHTGQVIEGSFTSTSVLVFLDGSGHNTGMYVGSFTYLGAAITSTSVATSYTHNSSTLNFSISGISISVGTYFGFLDAGNGVGLRQYLLSGDDSINGSIFDDVLYGDAGNDSLYSNGGNDVLYGGSGNDSIIGGTGSEFLYGEDGNDTIFGGDGDDTIEGGAGNDIIDAGAGLNIVDAGSGDDTVQGQVRQVLGGDGNDTITVGLVSDFVDGGNGNDVISGFGLLRGGNGDDVLTSPSTFDLGVTYSMYGGSGIDSLNGGASKDLMFGDEDNDHLLGGAADDVLDGGTGADLIEGGTGSDQYVVDDISDVVVEQAGQGEDTVLSSVSFVLPSNVEILVLTGTGNIDATGSDADDQLTGNSGNNTLSGGTGSDVLRGGAGNDVFLLSALDTADEVIENAHEGTDLVRSAFSYVLPSNVEQLELTGTGAINATGNTLDNLIVGNAGNNTLRGEGGSDTLRGGDGDDIMFGGTSNDYFDGEGGVDTVSYAESAFAVAVSLNMGIASATNGAADTLVNVERVIGSALADVLIGYVGIANGLSAGDGDDFIFFDSLDTVAGGSGTDRAVVLGADGVTLTMSDIEWLWGSNAADAADASAQTVTVTIFGLGGNDTLTGGSGDDQLYGQDGADTLSGGEGDDWLYVDSQDIAGGNVQGGGGADRAASLDGSALAFDLGASSIEWVWASNLGDDLDGSTQTNGLFLFSFDGADTLHGGSGNDSLYGMAGADAMYGGGGNDVLYFDSDDTMVDGSTGYDTAQVLDYTGVGVTLDLGARQIEAVYASNQADTLDASVATWAVFMNGYNGDDVMSGGSGDDNIYGGGGADTISGGGGNDFLDGSGGPEIDTLVVSGAQADYVLHYTGGVLTSVQDLVGGRDGWDNVAGFEQVQFSDGVVIL